MSDLTPYGVLTEAFKKAGITACSNPDGAAKIALYALELAGYEVISKA